MRAAERAGGGLAEGPGVASWPAVKKPLHLAGLLLRSQSAEIRPGQLQTQG